MPHHLFDDDHPHPSGSGFEAFKALKRSMMLNRRLLGTLLADDEMHPAQAGCLQALSHHDGMSQSDLATALHVSRPTVTTMLQRMEASGTIVRRADEDDSRITRVYLTDSGRATAERMREVLVEVLRLSLGSLSEDERAELARLLTAINDNMEAALAERGCATGSCQSAHEGGEGL